MKAGKSTRLWIIVAALTFLVAACGTGPQPSPAEEVVRIAVAASATLLPSATPTPEPTPTPTPTSTPTPTPHPLTIPSMREREYPGSEVTIVETLAPGSNYSRYIASYESEGLTIYALLTVPNGEKPPTGWPAIVFNHGFIPPDEYRTTERYVAYVDWLARSGYIVFRSDYRGHGDSEGEARGAYGSPDYTVDVLNAVATLKRFPDADPNRIGMWGHSLGGYLTLRSMIITDDIKAGVIWAGVVGPYPNLFVRPTATPTPEGWTPEPTTTATPRFGRRWRSELTALYGTPEENPDFWNSISSNSYLGDVSGPIQLHHGTADRSVPLAASETLYRQMLEAGKPVELYTYEGDDHNLAQSFGLAMQRTIEFFDKYLKGS
ncbi:MAG TPA: alpha/beta fold hydrolase [Anaerolineae bacterium]|nr:alpha/beta fold hydrolase [Anaerolineae bacterium]